MRKGKCLVSNIARGRGLNLTRFVLMIVVGTAAAIPACRAARTPGAGAQESHARRFRRSDPPIQRVACVYDQRPWLNLDTAGDRDPEGVAYRIFLDPGDGRGVLRDGVMHIEMYRLEMDRNGEVHRRLVSDWHYPTAQLPTIANPGWLGDGYFPRLRWATKDIAGSEVEIITRFESQDGREVRSQTKRFRVPKYTES